MSDPSCFANPTPLAHADTSRDVLPRGGTSQHYSAARGLLVTDLVILNHGQFTRTPELAPPLLTSTPNQREDI
ncbi:hypothetical protein TNCV_2536801 [Trichonephila clavipes]|nr:hypothetical protein TNCV_2536801 [Trichonephila clavipes]